MDRVVCASAVRSDACESILLAVAEREGTKQEGSWSRSRNAPNVVRLGRRGGSCEGERDRCAWAVGVRILQRLGASLDEETGL